MENQEKKPTPETPVTSEQSTSPTGESTKKTKPKWIVPAIIISGVIILGVGVWAGYNYWLKPAVPEEQPSKQQSEEKDEFVDWKTYRNEEYGFEVKHPEELIISRTHSDPPYKEKYIEFSENIVIFNSSNYNGYKSGFRITLRGPASLLPGENWREDFNASGMFDEIDMNGQILLKHDASSENYVLVANTLVDEDIEKVVMFDLEAHLNKEEVARHIYNQILSTFKFIKPIEISEWKIYRNEEYGFELKLPPRWANAIIEQISDKTFLIKLEDRSVCDISVYSDEDWKQYQEADTTNKPLYLINKGDLIFGWSCGHDDYGYKGFEDYNNAIDNNNFEAINSGEILGPFAEFKSLILPTFKFIDLSTK